jgi:[acyl-carrier-protein] S-malonyltransferase
VKKAADVAKAKGAKRAVLLPVSAPFHSALLQPAAERLAAVLRGVRFRDLGVPLVTNVDADLLREGARVADTLVRQVTAPVRWEDGIRRLATEGVTVTVEVGPGKVLSGLIRRIAPEMQVVNVEDRASLQATLEALR